MAFTSQRRVVKTTDRANLGLHARKAFAAFAACALCVFLVGCAGTSAPAESSGKIESLAASDTPATPDGASSSALENPIDFESLRAENGDVYAWLYVPDTAVNDPVLQNSLDDNFYLTHDIYLNESAVGAPYTQSKNAKGFTDPVTLMYGHTFEEWQEDLKDEGFGTLHNFEDPDFFANHENFYIYLPGKVLTYQVVSAYEYDNRHIINSFDFSDEAVVQQYFDYVVNPDSMVKNVREGITLKAGENKIVQLSTCTRPSNDAARYLVTGVLVDEQRTS